MKNKYLLIALLIAFISIQAWFLQLSFNHKFSGISVERDKNDQWVIKEFDVSDAGAIFGLKIGDTVRKVNGKEADDYPFIKSWRNLDQYQTLLIERNGKEFEIIPPKNTWYWADLLFYAYFGEVLCFIMALLLYKILNSTSARYLSLVFLDIGIIFMSLGASIRGDLLGKFMIGTGVMLLPIIFLHFLVILLREKGNLKLSSAFLKYLYIPIVLLSLVYLSFIKVTKATYYIYHYMIILEMLYFVLGFFLNLLFLIYLFIKYRKAKTYASTIIKTVCYALFISFSPLIFLSFIPKLLSGFEWVNSPITGWAVLLFPISFAYLISTKQLYDIDTILRRILLTTLISIVPSGIIVGFISLFLSKEYLIIRLLIIFIFILILITIVLYSLEYISTKLENVMFPRKHQLKKALKKISQNMKSISNMRELKEIILVDIVQTLQVVGGAIVFQYRHEIESITTGRIDQVTTENALSMYNSDSDVSEYSVFPINHHEEYSSYLVMTRNKTNTHLNLEEKQWLGLIISYLAVSLENLYLIRKLTMKVHEMAAQIPNEQAAQDLVWFRKIMFELQEKERVRIAMDLHDTTMQDLYFLKGKIEVFMKEYTLLEESDRKLASIYDYIEIINSNLRQSCFELYPHLLQEIGLIETIRQVIEQEEIGFSFTLQFITKGASAIEESGLETKRHLFRIFQELLNNAKKHSQASKVKIELLFLKDDFYFIYEDDGIGFEESRLTNKEINSSGNGIEQLKSRAIYLNGQFELDTKKGKGVKMKFILPKEGLTE